MQHYFTPKNCEILAYCLMPNHYHILLQIKIDDFGRKVMLPFSTSYTKAINKQQNRVGSLFQGSYQFRHIASTPNLLMLSRYIHRNPVEAGFTNTAEEWTYSSHTDYLGKSKGNFVNTQRILRQFENPPAYAQFVSEGADHRVSPSIFID